MKNYLCSYIFFIFILTGCNLSKVQDCFEIAKKSPEIPKYGRCEALGYINDDFGSYFLTIGGPDPKAILRVYVGADAFERGPEIKNNIGKEIKIVGKFTSVDGVILSISNTENFEVLSTQKE